MEVELSAEGKSSKVGVEPYKVRFPNIFEVLFKNFFYIIKPMGKHILVSHIYRLD